MANEFKIIGREKEITLDIAITIIRDFAGIEYSFKDAVTQMIIAEHIRGGDNDLNTNT